MIRGNPITEIVLVLDSSGASLGRMSHRAANQLATERNLDLVQINKSGECPVYKIMDQGKWRYLKKKNQKKSHVQLIKEMNFKMRIDSHDRETKINQIKRFLSKGMDVKISIHMRGREKGNPELARQKMDGILSEIESLIILKQKKSSPSIITAMVRPSEGTKHATSENNKEIHQKSHQKAHHSV